MKILGFQVLVKEDFQQLGLRGESGRYDGAMRGNLKTTLTDRGP